ncbi:unnamed protein product [Candidula unifasciata]|uniref:Uncharacterized protein n=1 Tax=Candidula unifasciata TaxID=100452 RepID=A0A8S3YPB1_9EUPU|nr:unnamed protein product [Candidula unifasciata]
MQQPALPLQPGQACMNVMNNTVVVTQPGGSGNSLLLIGKDKLQFRSWTSHICSCFNDCTSCILGTMCLPILLCRVSNRLNECALITCCAAGGFMALRTKLRTMGGIKGSICSDCFMTTCCGPCAACQMSREMDSMGL